MRNLAAILFCFGLPLLAGALGGLSSANAPEFYGTLQRPPWAPPSWLFGPVWTALYLMMGLAAYLVWRERGWSWPLWLFAVHIVFNAVWSPLFFSMRNGALAFADIVILWLMIGALLFVFARISTVAAILLVPYWLWVTFASALNFVLWRRNPGLL
jgi:tryptophan-rich sensory protein